ncbi:MAG: ATP-binding protein [Eubacteriales bacterium]
MYIKRSVEQTIKNIIGNFPVLLIIGPRQIGKTTLLRSLAEEGRKYVSLDDPGIRDLAVREPALFLQRYSPPVIIDEIQYAPELLPHIKMYVDADKTKGSFWLTGTHMFPVSKGAGESLAGRVGIIYLSGLSNSEISGNLLPEFSTSPKLLMQRISKATSIDMMTLFERIHRGSMPALYEQESVDWENYYSSYLQTFIRRDIKGLIQVNDDLMFYRFLCIAAARTGSMVNYDLLAKETEISAPTAKQWVSLLVSTGIVALIEPYYNSALKRVVKSPRMYFLDTGLAAYLSKWHDAKALEAGAMSTAFFETWVVSEIYKSFLNAGKTPPLNYYRDSNAKEIDLIISQLNVIYPIEIRKSSHPEGVVSVFDVLKPITDDQKEEPGAFASDGFEHYGTLIGTGAVICLCNDLLPIDRKNWLVPAWLI